MCNFLRCLRPLKDHKMKRMSYWRQYPNHPCWFLSAELPEIIYVLHGIVRLKIFSSLCWKRTTFILPLHVFPCCSKKIYSDSCQVLWNVVFLASDVDQPTFIHKTLTVGTNDMKDQEFPDRSVKCATQSDILSFCKHSSSFILLSKSVIYEWMIYCQAQPQLQL